MILTLDIETLCTTDAETIATIRAGIKPPATHKKPETIAAWLDENLDSATSEAVAKTSFDALYGSIACICYQFDDGEVFSVDSNSAGDEKTMLEHFYAHVFDKSTAIHETGLADIPLTVCGHNVAGFDLPFLRQRSQILGVIPPAALLKAMRSKPWSDCIADTMMLWCSDSQKRASMDKLCKAFGIEGKGDFDGSMVAETWPVDPEKVIEYCKDDVRRTRQIYKRLTWSE